MSKSEALLAMDDEGKISAVYYFYLSLDNVPVSEKQRHFESLFDLRQNLTWYLSTLGLKESGETLPEDDGKLEKYLVEKIKNPEVIEYFSIAMPDFAGFKEDVIRLCEEAINRFEDDERYEGIVEEIDSLLMGSPRGISSYDGRKYLWQFIMYSVSENLLTEQRRRFLKHFARIAGIDKSVLNEMEEAALSFTAIGKKRTEAKTSDAPYSKVIAVLSVIDTEEGDAIKRLYEVYGLSNDDGADETDDEEDDYDDGTPIIEKIGQGVVDVLDGIADKLSDFAAKL